MMELKECPFCGKAGKIEKKEYAFLGVSFIPHCSNDSCLMFTARKEYKTEDGAKKAWNRRTEETKRVEAAKITKNLGDSINNLIEEEFDMIGKRLKENYFSQKSENMNYYGK